MKEIVAIGVTVALNVDDDVRCVSSVLPTHVPVMTVIAEITTSERGVCMAAFVLQEMGTDSLSCTILPARRLTLGLRSLTPSGVLVPSGPGS